MQGYEGIKPGWVRVNFNYFISDAVFDFVVEAVQFVAENGWKLLPHYTFDVMTAHWRHRLAGASGSLEGLGAAFEELDRLVDSAPAAPRLPIAQIPESALRDQLAAASGIVSAAVQDAQFQSLPDARIPAPVEALPWFPLPAEISAELQGLAGAHSRPPLRLR